MLKINFYPDFDKNRLFGAVKEYEDMWEKENGWIVEAMEKVSGLKFRETYINAIVYEGSLPPRSRPLSLRIGSNKEKMLATLIHELGHKRFTRSWI